MNKAFELGDDHLVIIFLKVSGIKSVSLDEKSPVGVKPNDSNINKDSNNNNDSNNDDDDYDDDNMIVMMMMMMMIMMMII